ncbi:MAG: ribosome assembly cofactor RimP [Bacteroidota bacterium]
MISKETIVSIANPLLEKENLFLVDVSVGTDNKVVVTIDGYKGVSIDSCVSISRGIEAALDRDKEDFELEVTSAGLGQPLRIPRQYIKNIGQELEVVLKTGEKVKGILNSANENSFTLSVSKKVTVEGSKKKKELVEPLQLTYQQAKSAKVVLKFK